MPLDTPWRRTVLVVGAGATLAEALPTHPPRARCPPLDSTFFDLCARLDIDGRSTLTDYLLEQYGLDPFADPPGMEEVFNLVYADTHSARDSGGAVAAYWALLKLYREAIRQTTNPLTGTSRHGVGRLLRLLLAKGQLERRTIVVTFNQDLVIEKAIQAMAETKSYGHVGWNFKMAYNLEFAGLLEPATRGTPFNTEPASQDYMVRICKLHGSLNWVHPVRSADDAKNALRDPPERIYCLNDAHVRGELRRKGQKRAQHLLPLVVPPIYEKSSAIRSFLQPLWKSATGFLSIAQEIIFFGYSLPPADVAANGLLRRAFYQNDESPLVTVIDPDSAVAARIADVLGTDAVRFYRSVDAYGAKRAAV